jgi:hypothetical protein
MSHTLSSKDFHFLFQGVKALQQETASQKAWALLRMFPEDNNLGTLLEYYDKRSVELHHLEIKILGMAST